MDHLSRGDRILGKSYNTIAFYPERCDGCNDCIEACAQIKACSTDPIHSRIKVVGDSEEGSFGVALCRQCGEPRCVMDCPAGALDKDEESGVVLWNEEKCVNCQLCTLACPYSAVQGFADATRVDMAYDLLRVSGKSNP